MILINYHIPCTFDLQERLKKIEQEIREEEVRQRMEAKQKRLQIDLAEKNRQAPVDDSKMVDDIFGFIDQTEEGNAPSAFKVC